MPPAPSQTPHNPPGRRGFCLVLAAPSGAGKSTLSRALRQADPALTLSISATTRAPRAGERDGEHYFFHSPESFAALRDSNGLLEHATVFGRAYGTPRAPVQAALQNGQDVMFDIDWQGFRQLRAALPGDVVGVFILPPSLDALAERLGGRGDGAEAIAARMQEASREISHWIEFDYLVLNDDLARATAELQAIITAERLRRSRCIGRAALAAAMSGDGAA